MIESNRLRCAVATALLALGATTVAHASPIGIWNFDTAWATGTTDTSGYGGGWVSRAVGFNSMTMDYAAGAAYGRAGGVAVITNSGNALSNGAATALSAGVRLLLVDGLGDPNADGYAFREAFEASMKKANNPFAQVDIWDDGSRVSAGLFAFSIRPSDAPFNAGSSNRVVTTTLTGQLVGFEDASLTVRGQTPRTAQAWRTLRMVLEADGDVEYLVDGISLGFSAQKYDTLASAYNGAFSMLVGTAGNVAGARQSMVFDNFQFGANANDVPEPSTFALAGLALLGIGAVSRRRKQV